jgi:hypothetical protein
MKREEKGDAGLDRLDLWLAGGLLVAFLLLYLRTLCPTVYLGDSGEISTAIATGGVIHPPGYPLLSLLGRAALFAIPWGEPAFRIGCVVALAAALAIGVLYLLARELDGSHWASAAAAAAFGLSYTFWSQSTRVEVYSLHVFLGGMALLAALRFGRTGQFSSLVGAALAMSLGLAHHLTVVLLAPTVLLLCGDRLWRGGRLGPRLCVLLLVSLTGPALYLLLLVWARAEPLQAWGHTVDLPLLLNHASARFYSGNLDLPDRSFLWQRLAGAGRQFDDTFPVMTGLLVLLGAARLWWRQWVRATALLIAVVAILLYNVCYRIDDIAPYYLVAWLIGAALVPLALDLACRLIPRPSTACIAAAGAAALLVTVPFCRNWSSCDLSRATWVREFARHKLENSDRDSVLITSTDNDTFPVWYVHDLLKVRPDVVHVDRAASGGTWASYQKDPSLWYLYRLRKQGIKAPMEIPRDPARWSYLSYDGYLIDLLNGPLRGRTICMTFNGTNASSDRDPGVIFRWATTNYRPLPVGIVLRLHPRNQRVDLPALVRDNEDQWARMTLPDLRHTRMRDELDPEYIVNHYACSLVNFGGLHEIAGNRSRAAALYRWAQEWAPGYEGAKAALAGVRGKAPSRANRASGSRKAQQGQS